MKGLWEGQFSLQPASYSWRATNVDTDTLSESAAPRWRLGLQRTELRWGWGGGEIVNKDFFEPEKCRNVRQQALFKVASSRGEYAS